MKLLRVLMASGFIAAIMWMAPPAKAQVPALPPQLDGWLELIGPAVSPACGELSSAYQLIPIIYSSHTGKPLPSGLLTLLGPVVVVCGSLPPLDPGQKLKCAPDKTIQDTVALLAAAAGQTLPASIPALFAPVGATFFAVQDNVPAPINTLPIAELGSTLLECEVVSSRTPADVQLTPAPAETSTSTGGDFTSGSNNFAFPLESALNPLGLPDASGDLGSVALPIGRPPVLTAAGTGFAYPVVFALPLLILVIGGFLGRALTQPVAPSRD